MNAIARRRLENRSEGQRLRKLLRYESTLWATGVLRVAGVDEAGMSPLAGPVGLEDERRRPGSKRGTARWVADRAVDTIRDRFGWEAVGYGPVALGIFRSVPDEFRQLAEKDL